MKPAKLQELSLDVLMSMAHNVHHKTLWPKLWCEIESRLGLVQGGEWEQEIAF